MNYHLLVDEKFLDSFIETAEKNAPGKNHYCFMFQSPGRYVKSTLGTHYSLQQPEFIAMLQGLTKDDRVFVHWFYDALMPCIRELPADVPLYLMFWGGDFLEQPEEFVQFNLEPKTRKLVSWLDHIAVFYPTLHPGKAYKQFSDFFTTKKRWIEYRSKGVVLRKEFMQRLNFFCHWNPIDLERLKEVYGGNAAFEFFYYNAELERVQLANNEHRDGEPYEIWLGNSANFPNNHLDAIDQLEGFSKENFQITAPLSYGNKRYARAVARRGRKVFSNKFSALTDFMPLNEYVNLQKKVDVVVMYHNRTQAAGNVFTFLRMGKKVYLKEESSIYQLALIRNMVVFNANNIHKESFEDFTRPLTLEQQEQNALAVKNLMNNDNYADNLRRLLN